MFRRIFWCLIFFTPLGCDAISGGMENGFQADFTPIDGGLPDSGDTATNIQDSSKDTGQVASDTVMTGTTTYLDSAESDTQPVSPETIDSSSQLQTDTTIPDSDTVTIKTNTDTDTLDSPTSAPPDAGISTDTAAPLPGVFLWASDDMSEIVYDPATLLWADDMGNTPNNSVWASE